MSKIRDLSRYTKIGDLYVNMDIWLSHQSLQPNGCIHWTAGKHKQGYGMAGALKASDLTRTMVVAHRLAMRIKLGRSLAADEYVIHKPGCSPLCCNQDHLFIGTLSDRHTVMVANGNARSGRKGKSGRQAGRVYKYTPEEIIWMRKSSIEDIMLRYNIDRAKAAKQRWQCRNGYHWCSEEAK